MSNKHTNNVLCAYKLRQTLNFPSTFKSIWRDFGKPVIRTFITIIGSQK